MPLFVDKETELDVKASSILGKQLIDSDLIIIDEVSAMKKDILEAINKLLKNLMRSSTIFGGKVMVLSGDFRQTLPVIEGVNSEILTAESSLLTCDLFTKNFERRKLSINMRARAEDEDFKKWLLCVGSGIEESREFGE